jgi:antirestriction protein ArdC
MRRPEAERRDIAAEITNLIIAKIEAGVAPWTRSWSGGGSSSGRPLRHNGEAYSGINCLYLWAVGADAGYSSSFWMTFNQALELGGQVRRGEKGSLSVYFNAINKTETDAHTGEESSRLIRFMRHYVVFNADQVDGLPPHFSPTGEPALVEPSTRQAAIDTFFDAIPADIRYGGDKAFFSPSHDFIQVPRKSAFKSQDHFASTLGHESCHWSGHPNRLARTFGKRFGDDAYAFEEIVATIGQSYICADLDLPTALHDSHASYIDHWLRVLKADKTAIIHAASKAEQAVRYLKSFSEIVVGEAAKEMTNADALQS